MMSTKTEPRCPECEVGTFIVQGIAGRKAIAFPGVQVELPADLEIPSCALCLEWSFYEEHEEAVKAAIAVGLLDWQKHHVPTMIEVLQTRDGVSRQRIAATLGVTPSHLSHVASGTNAGSSTLLRLLYAYVVSGTAFKHALEGVPLEGHTDLLVVEECFNTGSIELEHAVTRPEDVTFGSAITAASYSAVEVMPKCELRSADTLGVGRPSQEAAWSHDGFNRLGKTG